MKHITKRTTPQALIVLDSYAMNERVNDWLTCWFSVFIQPQSVCEKQPDAVCWHSFFLEKSRRIPDHVLVRALEARRKLVPRNSPGKLYGTVISACTPSGTRDNTKSESSHTWAETRLKKHTKIKYTFSIQITIINITLLVSLLFPLWMSL